MNNMFDRFIFVIVGSVLLFSACRNAGKNAPLFEVLSADRTGLDVANRLTPDSAMNMLNYMYFYNGAGMAAGDMNGDGRIDLFFCSNQGPNRIFLNEGGLKFRDVSQAAGLPRDGAWSTGASIVDLNSDGLPDIYVCRLGNYGSLHHKNQLLICTGVDSAGVPRFEDQAEDWGIAFSGFSTQAAFLDYDKDGDLDMYLMNHSLRYNSTFAARETYENTYDSLSGDRFYRNDGGHFTEVTRTCGIHSSVIGYGLGIVVDDFDLDGYPDIYIGNDFHENDYLYLNQRNGSFKEVLTERIMHTSQFSMGVEAGDLNNDAQPEILSVDMLPEDPYILRRSLGEDEYNVFQMKLRNGYNHQYARNNLQYNRGNGYFSEVGMYAGVHATDWSWGPLFADFDNDGYKDIFISNGIPRRLNDIDYVNYISNDNIQQKIRSGQVGKSDMSLIERFPQIKLRNKFFRNQKDLRFEDLKDQIDSDRPTFSNGAVYADFDNDGDLDIAVSNIDEEALVYRNTHADKGGRDYVRIQPRGNTGNLNGIGSLLVVYAGDKTCTYYKSPVRGFQSSMEIPLHAGLSGLQVDSMIWVWPDGSCERVPYHSDSTTIYLTHQARLRLFDFSTLRSCRTNTSRLKDVTNETGFQSVHRENLFNEFDRELLSPHMVSTEGPGLAVADLNGDGLDDLFVGSSRGHKSELWIQTAEGRWASERVPALEADSIFEDVAAVFADVDGNRLPDLIVGSGGNEFYGQTPYLRPRVYLNMGAAGWQRKHNAFHDSVMVNASCLAANDFTGDGSIDLFIGGRSVPFQYGETPNSFLLENDGAGRFTVVTGQWNPQVQRAGLVTDAGWYDMDKDGDKDLVLALEWDGLAWFEHTGKQLTRHWITVQKGWWRFVVPVDLDGDGDLDLVAGNQGLNNRFHASREEPVTMYFGDFDGNGIPEQIVTYFVDRQEIPFPSKSDLEKQMPTLRKKFLYAEDFARAKLSDLVKSDALHQSIVRKVDFFSSAVFINQGDSGYRAVPLPWQAQLSTLRSVFVHDFNRDGLPDLWLAGNFHASNVQLGRSDADYGTMLWNRGTGQFAFEACGYPVVTGQVRKILPFRGVGRPSWVLAKNNGAHLILQSD